MRRAWGPQFLGLFLLLLAVLTPPGNGNEGSSAGSCRCDKRLSSSHRPTDRQMKHLLKQLKHYNQCTTFVRFHLPRGTVCGGSRDPWVIELISCFEHKECGHAYSGEVAHQEHLPPPSSQVPESTEGAPGDTGISAQTYLPPTLQSTKQPTRPGGTLFLDKKLIHASETATSSVDYTLEAGGNKKRLEENVGPTAGTPAMVPVLSLLAISFILTAALLYVLCKRRSKKSLQYSPDLQL